MRSVLSFAYGMQVSAQALSHSQQTMPSMFRITTSLFGMYIVFMCVSRARRRIQLMGLSCYLVWMAFVLQYRYDFLYHGKENGRDRGIDFRYGSMLSPCFAQDWRVMVGDDAPFTVASTHNVDPNATKILSYSVYGTDPKYFDNIVDHARNVHAVYPGWAMRVHVHDQSPAELIQALIDAGAQVYIMHDDEVRPGNAAGMFWRFLPMADPSLDVFVKDSDDNLSESKFVLDTVLQSPDACIGGVWHYPFLKTFVRGSAVAKRRNCSIGLDEQMLLNFPIRRPYGADEYFMATQLRGEPVHVHITLASWVGFPFARDGAGLCRPNNEIWYHGPYGLGILILCSGLLCAVVACTAHVIFASLGGACYACISPIKTMVVVTIFASWGAPINTVGLLGAVACGALYTHASLASGALKSYSVVAARGNDQAIQPSKALLAVNIAASILLVCALRTVLQLWPNPFALSGVGALATLVALHARKNVPLAQALNRQDSVTMSVCSALSIGLVNVSLRENSVGAYEILKCMIVPMCFLMDRMFSTSPRQKAAAVGTVVFTIIGTVSRPYGITMIGALAGIVSCACAAREQSLVCKIAAQHSIPALYILRATLPLTTALMFTMSAMFETVLH